ALARGVLAVADDDRKTFLKPMWEALTQEHSDEEAAARMIELLAPLSGDGSFMWDVSTLFVGEGEKGYAIQALEKVLSVAPRDPNALGQLGRLLAESIPTRARGLPLLERAIANAPRWDTPRRNLALRVIDEAPERALE